MISGLSGRRQAVHIRWERTEESQQAVDRYRTKRWTHRNHEVILVYLLVSGPQLESMRKVPKGHIPHLR